LLRTALLRRAGNVLFPVAAGISLTTFTRPFTLWARVFLTVPFLFGLAALSLPGALAALVLLSGILCLRVVGIPLLTLTWRFLSFVVSHCASHGLGRYGLNQMIHNLTNQYLYRN
jgi:hypothetical protein